MHSVSQILLIYFNWLNSASITTVIVLRVWIKKHCIASALLDHTRPWTLPPLGVCRTKDPSPTGYLLRTPTPYKIWTQLFRGTLSFSLIKVTNSHVCKFINNINHDSSAIYCVYLNGINLIIEFKPVNFLIFHLLCIYCYLMYVNMSIISNLIPHKVLHLILLQSHTVQSAFNITWKFNKWLTLFS